MRKRAARLPYIVLILLVVALQGCVGMTQDVTPPPDAGMQATINPQPQSTQDPIIETPVEEGGLTDEQNRDVHPGTVLVNVIDHTGEHEEHDLLVQLDGFDHTENVFSESKPLKEDGSVDFEAVPLQNGHLYFATIEYDNALYRSDLIEVEPDTVSLDLTIDLFGTTTNTNALSIDRIHLFLDFQQADQIQVGEIYVLSNFGKRTVVAENRGDPVLSFPLPDQASNLEFENGVLGQRFRETRDGFGDTVAIPPGSGVYQVMVFYTLPYQGRKLDFVQQMNYPVGAVIVITPVDQVRLKGSYLEDLGIREVQNGSIHVYAGEELNPGEILRFQITGGMESVENLRGFLSLDTQWGWILLGILGGGLIALGVVLLFNSRDAVRKTEPDLDHKRTQILDSIIALDDLYNEGEVTKAQYQQKRTELKAQLKALLEKKESRS